MNRDFAEMLRELSAAGAEFLIVGAHVFQIGIDPVQSGAPWRRYTQI